MIIFYYYTHPNVARSSYQVARLAAVHFVFRHVGEFCRAKGTGLAPYSEQTFEPVHARFWEFVRYRLPNEITDPSYGQKLFKVVTAFNALRIS